MLPLRRSMYAMLLALGVCLRLCAARAVANDVPTAQMHTSSPASGSLFQLAANALLNQRNAAVSPHRTSVSLPLGPMGNQVRIEPPRYSYGPFPMKGGALIYALSCEAYDIWRQTTTQEIHTSQKTTFPPFHFIGVELKPTAVAPTVLTSVKMGSALEQLTVDMFLGQTRWPGAIEVRVMEVISGPPPHRELTRIPLGRIFVQPSFFWKSKKGIIPPGPLGMGLGKALSVQSGSNSTDLNSGILGAPIQDRTWLHCFSKMMCYIFARDASRPVTDDIHPPRAVVARDVPGMIYSLDFTKDIPQKFRWVDLAMGMIHILREWALGDQWEPMENGRILMDGVVVVEVRIVPVPSVEEETAVATA